MKFGMRKPSIKRSIKARTTSRVKRAVKKSVIPFYGKKGTGWIKNPKKALYNKIYNKTSFSFWDILRNMKSNDNGGVLMKKIIAWGGVVVFAMLALVAFSLGGVIGGVIFLLIAFICSPFRSLLLNFLPEKLRKKGLVIATSVVLFFAGFLGIPTDNTETTEPTTETAEEVTSVSNENKDIELDETDKVAVVDKSASETTNESTKDELLNDSTTEAVSNDTEKKVTTTKKATEDPTAAQKKADDEAAKKAAEEAATKKAAEEAAAQKEAEEAAAQKAAQEAAAAQTVPQVNSSTVANGTESANALAVLQMGPTTGSPCWVPRNGGQKYHSKSSCSGMEDPIYTTVDTATQCGFDACKRCH